METTFIQNMLGCSEIELEQQFYELHTINDVMELFLEKVKEKNEELLHGVLEKETIPNLWNYAFAKKSFLWNNFKEECADSNQLNFKEWYVCCSPIVYVFYKNGSTNPITHHHNSIFMFQYIPIHCASLTTKRIMDILFAKPKQITNNIHWIIVTENLEDIFEDDFVHFYLKQSIRQSNVYTWLFRQNSCSLLIKKISTFDFLQTILENVLMDTKLLTDDTDPHSYKSNIQHVYIMSVHSNERGEFLKRYVETELKLHCEIVSFDKKNQEDETTLTNLLKLIQIHQKYANTMLDIKKLVCFLKIHRREFYQMRTILCLYDDIHLHNNFQEKLTELFTPSTIPTEWDAIFLNERYKQKLLEENVGVGGTGVGGGLQLQSITGNICPPDAFLIKSKSIKTIISLFELSPLLFTENIYQSFCAIKTHVTNYNLVQAVRFPSIPIHQHSSYEDVIHYFCNYKTNPSYANLTRTIDQVNKVIEIPKSYNAIIEKQFPTSNTPILPKIIHRIMMVDATVLQEMDPIQQYTIQQWTKTWEHQSNGCQFMDYTLEDVKMYQSSFFPRWESLVARVSNPVLLARLFGYIKVYETGGTFCFNTAVCHSGLDTFFLIRDCEAIVSLQTKNEFYNISGISGISGNSGNSNFAFEHPRQLHPDFLFAIKHSEFLRAVIYHIIQYVHLAIYFNVGELEKVVQYIFDNAMSIVFYKYWNTEQHTNIFVMDIGNIGNQEERNRYDMQITHFSTIPPLLSLYIKPEIVSNELDIFLLVKNNEEYLKHHFWDMMDAVESSLPKIKFNYYVYENDSIDHTLEIVYAQRSVRNMTIISKRLGSLNKTKRTYRLGIIRNELSDVILRDTANGRTNADLVLCIDTDVIFNPHTIHTMIGELLTRKDAIMIGSQCFAPDDGYYDTLALEMGRFHLSRSMFLKSLELSSNNLFRVTSCFGGMCLLYKYAFQYCHYGMNNKTLPGYFPNITCEHYNFCRNLHSFGNIYISKMSISHWVCNWLTEGKLLLEKLRRSGFYVPKNKTLFQQQRH